MEELDTIIQHIYEDNVLGKLSDARYLKLSSEYEREQEEINRLAAALEREPRLGRLPMWAGFWNWWTSTSRYKSWTPSFSTNW